MKNERINLTPGYCRDLKPKDELYYVQDYNCPGLWFWIYPSGFKTWYYHYRPKGKKPDRIKLGRFEMLNPSQARTRAKAESLRSRRRRGLYQDQYVLKNKSYRWKRPRQMMVGATAFNRSSVKRGPSSLKLAVSGLSLDPRSAKPAPRNKNNGNHRAGITKNYPNRQFEIANEIRMVAKAQRKINDAEAQEIVPEVIELAKQKHREKLLKKCEPIKTNNFVYGRGIYDARNEPIPNKRIRWPDEIEDDERAFWSKKYY